MTDKNAMPETEALEREIGLEILSKGSSYDDTSTVLRTVNATILALASRGILRWCADLCITERSVEKIDGLSDAVDFFDAQSSLWNPHIGPLLKAAKSYLRLKPGPATENDSWIEWHGGDCLACPVPGDTPVEVKFRNGIGRSYRAHAYNWQHSGRDTWPWDIVAYRIINEENQ